MVDKELTVNHPDADEVLIDIAIDEVWATLAVPLEFSKLAFRG